MRSNDALATNRIVTAYIARDGVEIGDFPRAEIRALVRRGELLPSDFYWHEGMENWLPLEEVLARGLADLPEAPAETVRAQSREIEPADEPHSEERTSAPTQRLTFPTFTRKQLGLGAALCAGVLVCALVALSMRSARRRAHNEATTLFRQSVVAPARSATDELALRDQAAADLKHRIERLPARAEPPLSIFYYDVSVNMKKSLSTRTPWTAEIHGRENVVDPATNQTLRRTEFALTSDYRDGEWTFKHYRALTTDLSDNGEKEEEHDENTPTPPSIVGMLGLKRKSE